MGEFLVKWRASVVRETWQAIKPANDLVLLDRQSHVGCMYNAHLSGMLWLVCVLLLIILNATHFITISVPLIRKHLHCRGFVRFELHSSWKSDWKRIYVNADSASWAGHVEIAQNFAATGA